MRVLIIGASKKAERYSNMAMKRLIDKNHEVVLFNPALDEIDGHPVINSLLPAQAGVDTVTLYVGPTHLEPMIDDIIAWAPRRIISNPGTESILMAERARKAGIEYLEACTLVLLSTGQF
jgi:predicted CoA-binding protein